MDWQVIWTELGSPSWGSLFGLIGAICAIIGVVLSMRSRSEKPSSVKVTAQNGSNAAGENITINQSGSDQG